ncbi:MAG: 4Fe-4S dicluster domain-containing protein [Candidatus Eisenbacteria bacterium]
MDSIIVVFVAVVSSLILIGSGAFGIQTLRERERRAASVAFAVALIGPLILLTLIFPPPTRLVTSGLIAASITTGILLLLIPAGRTRRGNDTPLIRVDERDIMFSRVRLVPGSPQYEAYYTLHPEERALDDEIRHLPGLLSLAVPNADRCHFASAAASFSLPLALRDWVDGIVTETPVRVASASVTSYVKGAAGYFGARAVGIAELKPYHVYSHIGRGSGEYGAPIMLDHRSAIAFTVEMDYGMVRTAPNAPEMMETARKYAEVAQVAVQLAALIRSLGYPARAHIDGNYRVIAPLVARDAGLGEIGRMGLLVSHDVGPRVRLGVVTTDLPLTHDVRDDNTSVINFCRACRKCAENCPSQAIPFQDRTEIDGALRWRIDAVRCFRFWSTIGTDCGRCLAVCPYSHPDVVTHNLVRRAIRCSGSARRAALWLDNVFYGRKPGPRPAPRWLSTEAPSRID